nr:hypothetical protein [Tanacetum cinerariifolium]
MDWQSCLEHGLDKLITHEITVLVQDHLMRLAEKTRVNASEFEKVLKEEMFEDLHDQNEQYFVIQYLKAQLQDKNTAISELKKLIEKMKDKDMDTNFEKSSILGKPPLKPIRNQPVVRQPTAFKSKRSSFSKHWFASQVVEKISFTKPVTPHSWPQVRQSAFAKPYHVNTHGPSRNSSKYVSFQSPNKFVGSNNMVHNYYLEEAKKNYSNLKYDSPAIPSRTVLETFLNMSPKNKAHCEAKAETIHLILTEIKDDIYLTVDTCTTVKDILIAIKRLRQGESLNKKDVKTNLFWEFGRFTLRDGESTESYYSRCVTIIKQTIDLDKESYHKLFGILKQYQKDVNEIHADKISGNANLLALIAATQQYLNTYYQAQKSHKSYASPSKQSSFIRSYTTSRHKGKELVKPITPPSKLAFKKDSDPEQAQIDKKMQKNLALIAKYFKKIYQPTNNNLCTSSNIKNVGIKGLHEVTIPQLVLLVYKVTTIFNKVNAARVTTANRVTTVRWIKAKMSYGVLVTAVFETKIEYILIEQEGPKEDLCMIAYQPQGVSVWEGAEAVYLQAKETKLEYSRNIVTNSREMPSWREIVSLTVLVKLHLLHYALWEVIINGDSPPPTRSVDGVETPYPPTTVDEKLARKNELKARGDGLEVADGNVNHESQKIPIKDKKESRAPKHQDNKNMEEPRRTVPVKDTTSNAMVSQCDGLGYDWSDQAKDRLTNFALLAYASSSSSSSDSKVNDKYTTGDGYHGVPPPYTGSFMPPKPNLVFVDEHVVSDSEDENKIETQTKQIKPSFAKVKFVKPTEHVKSLRKSVKQEESNRLGDNFEFKNEACYECGSFNHLIKDCASYKKKMVEKPVWNSARRGNPQQDLQEKRVIDSGYSRHMTGNMSYIYEYEEIDGGYVAFGGDPKRGKINDTECVVLSPNFKLLDESQVLLRVPRQNNMYSVELRNVTPSGGLTRLFTKAILDESNLWHKRLRHINFKTMNKLVRGNLVRGLPSKIFENDHTCVAYQKGKQHKASCKTRTVNSISQPLKMFHMDLFGLTFVKSIMKKMYCLVVTDD